MKEAVLSNKGEFTIFSFEGVTIFFRSSSKLRRYTKVLEWNKGYIVVMAQYEGCGEEEEYIDLEFILTNLGIAADAFLSLIDGVRIE